MNNKLLFILTSALTVQLLAAPAALADKGKKHHKRYQQYDYARVVEAEPIIESVHYSEPYEQCHYEEHVIHHGGSKGALLLGTLIGGAIGKEIGDSGGSTVAGALIGASIADNIDGKRRGYHTEKQRVCQTHYEDKYKQTVTGYDVTYRYRGKLYYTIMDHRPGKRIKVAVSVRPVKY